MVGWSGLERVEYWLRPGTGTDGKLADDDPAWKTAVWRPCELMPRPDEWAAILPRGTSPWEVWGFDPTTGKPLAKVIAKLGDFYGIDDNGIAQGFLFPASLAFSKDGQTLYVSNLTLFLPYAGATVAIDSAWTLQVKGYTVSQISASIPPLNPGDDEERLTRLLSRFR